MVIITRPLPAQLPPSLRLNFFNKSRNQKEGTQQITSNQTKPKIQREPGSMLGETLASNGDTLSSSSSSSTPFASAYFFSAPASPTHFLLSSSPAHPAYSSIRPCDLEQADFEFDLAARSMSTAEELFVNGQIRPGFVSTDQAPMPHPESVHRRTRSVSPTRTPLSLWRDQRKDQSAAFVKPKQESETELNSNMHVQASGASRSDEMESVSVSASTSRSSSSNSNSSSFSSSNANSRRWAFIKEFLMLQRSKSEGGLLATAGAGSRPAQRQRNNNSTSCANGRGRVEHSASFSPALYKERQRRPGDKEKAETGSVKEMRRHTTFLPYKQQGFLFGCLGLSSSRLARNVGIATVSARQR